MHLATAASRHRRHERAHVHQQKYGWAPLPSTQGILSCQLLALSLRRRSWAPCFRVPRCMTAIARFHLAVALALALPSWASADTRCIQVTGVVGEVIDDGRPPEQPSPVHSGEPFSFRATYDVPTSDICGAGCDTETCDQFGCESSCFWTVLAPGIRPLNGFPDPLRIGRLTGQIGAFQYANDLSYSVLSEADRATTSDPFLNIRVSLRSRDFGWGEVYDPLDGETCPEQYGDWCCAVGLTCVYYVELDVESGPTIPSNYLAGGCPGESTLPAFAPDLRLGSYGSLYNSLTRHDVGPFFTADLIPTHVGPCIEAVDPNPGGLDVPVQGQPLRPAAKSLIDDAGRIIGTNKGGAAVDLLATGGYPFEKVSADGITPILLRVPTDEPVTFQIDGLPTNIKNDGSLVPLLDLPLQIIPGAGAGITAAIPVTGAHGVSYAFAVYIAPPTFEHARHTVPIVVKNASAQELGRINISLVPPPAMLVHGIWGNSAEFRCFRKPLEAAGIAVYVLDYGSDGRGFGSATIEHNVPVRRLHTALGNALRAERTKGVALTRFNLVAHSMGGLVTRARERVLGADYFTAVTLGVGDVYRLVTLDTPHQGSDMSPFALSNCIQDWFDSMGAPSHNGGVADLDPESAAIRGLPPHPSFLVHTITGAATEQQEAVALRLTYLGSPESCGSCPCDERPDCGTTGDCAFRRCRSVIGLAAEEAAGAGFFHDCSATLECPAFPREVCEAIGACYGKPVSFCRKDRDACPLTGDLCSRPLTTRPDALSLDVYESQRHDIMVDEASQRAGRSGAAVTAYEGIVHSRAWTEGGVSDSEEICASVVGPLLCSREECHVGKGSVLFSPRVMKRTLELLLGPETSFDHL